MHTLSEALAPYVSQAEKSDLPIVLGILERAAAVYYHAWSKEADDPIIQDSRRRACRCDLPVGTDPEDVVHEAKRLQFFGIVGCLPVQVPRFLVDVVGEEGKAVLDELRLGKVFEASVRF